MRSFVYILMALYLSGCISKKDASNDKAVIIVSTKEDVITLSPETKIADKSFAVEERIDVREIEKMNARKRGQKRFLGTNYVDPTIKPEGGPKFIILPSDTTPPDDLHRPNTIGSRHEKMMERTRALMDHSELRWHTKNLKK